MSASPSQYAKRLKHDPCWDPATKTGYFRRINLVSYTQRMGKYRGKWLSKDFYMKPLPDKVILACENCGKVIVRGPR